MQLEGAKPEPTSKLQPAPSDAELRAQAAESRLSRQVRLARQAQQFPATEAQRAQQAGLVTAHQAPQQVRTAKMFSAAPTDLHHNVAT